MSDYIEPLPSVVLRWPTRPTAALRDGRGPERIADSGTEDAKFVRRQVGFTARLDVAEPLLWDGDNG